MTRLNPLARIKGNMENILSCDKSDVIEKLRLGEESTDSTRCDLEQLFGMTAYLYELHIEGLVEKDRDALDESLQRIYDVLQEIREYDAADIDGMAKEMREKIRQGADDLYAVTLPWRNLVTFLYE